MNKVVVHIPHSSTHIPEKYKGLLTVDEEMTEKVIRVYCHKIYIPNKKQKN